MGPRGQIEFAERTRRRLHFNVEAFSMRLGCSANAYRMALRRKKISRWMMQEIERLSLQPTVTP